MSLYDLPEGITAHSWNQDGTQIAICMNSPVVQVFDTNKGKPYKDWKLAAELKLHTMVVTGIDWCKTTDRIVTCSHDVNAFVWTFSTAEKKWIPKICILKIERAAIRAKWSPDGTKFAVSSGSKVASICYFKQDQDFWVSQLTRRGQHKSTILDVAWHPSSQLFATACCDFKCRIFSAFIPDHDRAGANTVFGTMDTKNFGQVITEFEATGAWIEAVDWSPSGSALVFAGHDSTISFVDLSTGTPVCSTIKMNNLPYTRVLFIKDDVVVAGGHDFKPYVFQGQGSNWDFMGSVDTETKQKAGGKSGFAGNMNRFKSKERTGATGTSGPGLKTIHTNLITDLCCYKDGFSSVGTDGNLVVWSKAAIKKAISGVKL